MAKYRDSYVAEKQKRREAHNRDLEEHRQWLKKCKAEKPFRDRIKAEAKVNLDIFLKSKGFN